MGAAEVMKPCDEHSLAMTRWFDGDAVSCPVCAETVALRAIIERAVKAQTVGEVRVILAEAR